MAAKKTIKKILIIEDELMLKEALVEKLGEEGYEVTGCTSADDAFESLEEDIPDLILTDLVMQNIDGFEVLRRLQEDAKLSKIPAIVISNQGEPSDIEKAESLGAIDFIVKAEHSLSEIVSKVNKVLK